MGPGLPRKTRLFRGRANDRLASGTGHLEKIFSIAPMGSSFFFLPSGRPLYCPHSGADARLDQKEPRGFDTQRNSRCAHQLRLAS